MTVMTETRNPYAASFAEFEGRLNGRRRSGIDPLRRAAFDRFVQLGFPTTRDEEWRYTNVAPIARTEFRPAPGGALSSHSLSEARAFVAPFAEDAGAALAVFVNGHYSPELSRAAPLPHGVRVGSLAEALEREQELVEGHLARYADYDQHAFVALNTAFLADGAFVYVPANATLPGPVHLIFLSTAGDQPTVTHPRTLVVAGASSRVTLVESYAGLASEPYFTNAVTEVAAAANSEIDHYRTQLESPGAFHVATLQVHQERDSRFSTQAVTLGGRLTRNDVNAMLAGEGIECTLNGLYMGEGGQHVDNHTRIDHAQPNCVSHELYKGILDGAAHGVFNGKIYVHPDAQKTDAKQTNKTLLLSKEAEIFTKPQLEIFADDVRCTHGATVGYLDETAIFYLRSRGIDPAAARALLTYAFASDIVRRVKVATVRSLLEERIFRRLKVAPVLEGPFPEGEG